VHDSSSTSGVASTVGILSSSAVHLPRSVLKRLKQHYAQRRVTDLVLAVGAIVATTTYDVIEKALETVLTKRLCQNSPQKFT
jgi:hypothetical protein